MSSIKDRVQSAVCDIYKQHGEVKSQELVDTARPTSSPIHDAFEWDDSIAGEKYRLIQADTWIRNVTIIIEDKEDVFIDVSVEDEQCQEPMAVNTKSVEFDIAIEDVEISLAALEQAIKKLRKVDKDNTIDFRKIKRLLKEFNECLRV